MEVVTKKVLFAFLSLILIIIIFVVAAGFTFKRDSSGKQEMVHTYLIPKDFTGCAWIRYSQTGAQPLKINNGEIIFRIPENGRLRTSTNYDSVASLHSTKIILIDAQGDPIKEVFNEYDIPPATGYSFDDQNPGDVSYINFDSTEENCRDF